MKKLFTLLFAVLLCCLFGTMQAAGATIEDGVYYITCKQTAGYVALGSRHGVDPYICFINEGGTIADDGYWIVTNTGSGYTFCNEVSGEYLVFTYGRDDAYYKYLTLATEPEDNNQFWDIIENEDGTLSLQSVADNSYWWNLRAEQGLLGTYAGNSRTDNERFVLHKKESIIQEETRTSFPEALHVWLADGRLEAYPLEYVTSHDEVDGQLIIETNIGETFSYPMADVTAINEQAPTDFPTFDTFKFNNKYNDQLFKDAEGEIVDDTVNVTVGAIGKRLTASFQLTTEDTYVYVNGELQESKVSRLRFDKDIYYLIAKQGSTILLPTADGTDYTMQPYGRFVKVHVDWLTDHAESVPCIYINTEDGQPVTSKEEYLNAEITINGMGVFPDMATTAVQIKGRGNSSWSWPKKPYRLKFEKKVAPLGMTKGKSWVLLANYQTGSLMANAIGMKAANLMATAAPNHIVPVELYMNGEYVGSYNFTEKLGFAGNSIDLDDESAAALLELDSYYDEPEGQKFRSVPYDLPINIKEPDFSEGTSSITLETVETAFNRFLLALYEGKDVSEFVDVDQLARFLMVNELICNYEVYHPKSTFCYRENFLNDASKYIFGPVWDLDWAFGYEQGHNYFQHNTTSNYWLDMPAFEAREFVRDLRFCNSSLSETYQTLWESFMQDGLTELMEYAQDYYDYAHTSFEHNNERWGDNTNYEAQATTAANWLEQRANQIYEDILNDVRPEPVEAPATDFFDNDKLYTLTCRRGDLVLNADATALDAGQNRTDATDEERQFAILNIDGKNYLYSPFNKKFVNINNTFVDYLGSPCYFTTNHPDGDYQHMILMTSHYDLLYVNNNSWTIVIDSWSTPDQGNRWIITPVADFDPTEALIIAGQLLKGDVNGDGTITIADVTALVNIILGKGNTEYKQAIADVNGDGSITIADVTALVNIILGKN